ncbi:3-dehydroquinate synthase [Patescibacteria group bacterium]|nr:3-dehydroquinate synthase [Patescibacteria group bacterium]MCL5797615.1 3-dehydroquinate synthase [Patescibacteria group bacterium]
MKISRRFYQTVHSVKNEETTLLMGSDILGNLHQLPDINSPEYSSFLLFADKNVFDIYGRKLVSSLKKTGKKVFVSLFDHGEKDKNLISVTKMIKPFISAGIDRKACLISFGGGVASDIGGFIASILLRGISSINLPTSLLAQTDAAIGGKSGVDLWLPDGTMAKNMIGSFRQPREVITDIDTLSTLPRKELLNGLGEMAKYAIGWDIPAKNQLQKLAKGNFTDKSLLMEIVFSCQKLKAEIIRKDPLDILGEREKLNFGHTVGHGVEGASKGRLSHGEAVSIGIAAAAKVSLLLGLLDNKDYLFLIDFLKKLNLPVRINGLVEGDILKLIGLDKKAGRFVLIKNPFRKNCLVIKDSVEKKLLEKALEYILI